MEDILVKKLIQSDFIRIVSPPWETFQGVPTYLVVNQFRDVWLQSGCISVFKEQFDLILFAWVFLRSLGEFKVDPKDVVVANPPSLNHETKPTIYTLPLNDQTWPHT